MYSPRENTNGTTEPGEALRDSILCGSGDSNAQGEGEVAPREHPWVSVLCRRSVPFDRATRVDSFATYLPCFRR